MINVNYWHWLGRIAPMFALLGLCLVLWMSPEHWTEYAIITIALAFGTVAFAWWWWVIYAVRDIFTMLNQANKKFEQVLFEIKNITSINRRSFFNPSRIL